MDDIEPLYLYFSDCFTPFTRLACCGGLHTVLISERKISSAFSKQKKASFYCFSHEVAVDAVHRSIFACSAQVTGTVVMFTNVPRCAD